MEHAGDAELLPGDLARPLPHPARLLRVIEEIEALVDQRAAKPLFDRLQELIHEDQPLTFLYESKRLGGAHKTLQDVEPNAISSFFNLRRWRLVDG